MENEIEIQDVENFRGANDKQFSHQLLVMRAMTRVIEIGGHELYEGWDEEITDKYGNKKIIYRENNKKAFIEAVKTCEMVMSCDLDRIAKKEIKKIKTKIENKKKKLLKNQKEWIEQLSFNVKKKLNITVATDEFFVKSLPFYDEFELYKVEKYRDIFSSLKRLTKRLDFYVGEDFEA